MRKMETANRSPKDKGRLVTKMKIGTRCSRSFSFAASLAEVEEAGYSPPVPKPVITRATVNIQNMPIMVLQLLAVARIPPRIIAMLLARH